MRLDERGKTCPLPVIDAKKALEACPAGDVVEVLVDNEIAVQNLRKMADHKGCSCSEKRLETGDYLVTIETGEAGSSSSKDHGAKPEDGWPGAAAGVERSSACERPSRQLMVVALASDQMGQGDEKLGRALMKGFVYALTQQDMLPDTVLMYNSGAYLSCKGSDSLEDLKELEDRGTEILTCGTCLNHYGLKEQLEVGGVTNMYEIVERLTAAGVIVRP